MVFYSLCQRVNTVRRVEEKKGRFEGKRVGITLWIIHSILWKSGKVMYVIPITFVLSPPPPLSCVHLWTVLP